MWLPLVTFPASFLKKSVEREGQRRPQIAGVSLAYLCTLPQPSAFVPRQPLMHSPYFYTPFPNHMVPLMHFLTPMLILHNIFHSASQPVQCLSHTPLHNLCGTSSHIPSTSPTHSPTTQCILVHPPDALLYLSYAYLRNASHTSLRPSRTLPIPHGSSCTPTHTLLLGMQCTASLHPQSRTRHLHACCLACAISASLVVGSWQKVALANSWGIQLTTTAETDTKQ